MTDAQFKTLRILAEADEPVPGSRRGSVGPGDVVERLGLDPDGMPRRAIVPNVNMRAVDFLVRNGLARRHLSSSRSVYTHNETYSITDEGKIALDNELRRRNEVR